MEVVAKGLFGMEKKREKRSKKKRKRKKKREERVKRIVGPTVSSDSKTQN